METTEKQLAPPRKTSRRPPGRDRRRGFSLVEVCLVIGLFAILVTIAIPIMTNSVPRKNLKGAARDLYSAMMRAKAEAARLGGKVTVHVNPDAGHFFRIFADNGEGTTADGKAAAGNGKFDKNLGEELIFEGPPLPSRVIFLQKNDGSELKSSFGYIEYGDGGRPPQSRTAVSFDRRGLPYRPGTTTVQNGSVTLCLAKSPENPNGVGKDSAVGDTKSCLTINVNKAGRVSLVNSSK